MFDWPYYTLRTDGLLYDERGRRAFARACEVPGRAGYRPAAPVFQFIGQAEAWLETYDLRGNVRAE